MINVVIVEDEKHIIDLIINILNEYCVDVNVLGSARTVDEASVLLEQTQPDILLLDIHLKGSNAFELLQTLDFSKYKIIFITAFDEYALKAFRYSASDYLLKPIDPEELCKSITKVSEEITQEVSYQLLKKNLEKLDTILLKTQDSNHVVPIKDIMYCQSDGNYTKIYISNKSPILISKSLKYYENLLDNQDFYRVHHSFLINLNWVEYVDKSASSIRISELSVPIAARRKSGFLKALDSHSFCRKTQ